MDEFGERLKRERSRLGLNQSEFAALGAVKQRAQYQYEKGMRRPNSDYLSAITAAGVDAYYLLTGEKASRLENEDEQRVVAGLRELDAGKRAALLTLIEAFTDSPQE